MQALIGYFLFAILAVQYLIRSMCLYNVVLCGCAQSYSNFSNETLHTVLIHWWLMMTTLTRAMIMVTAS